MKKKITKYGASIRDVGYNDDDCAACGRSGHSNI